MIVVPVCDVLSFFAPVDVARRARRVEHVDREQIGGITQHLGAQPLEPCRRVAGGGTRRNESAQAAEQRDALLDEALEERIRLYRLRPGLGLVLPLEDSVDVAESHGADDEQHRQRQAPRDRAQPRVPRRGIRRVRLLDLPGRGGVAPLGRVVHRAWPGFVG